EQTPSIEEVVNRYRPELEHIQEQSYRRELQLRKLKRCL
ncbi:MAG: IS481 family transposase, partial [Desulfovibrionaceae bacterium]|nr:IS481 family transposase [Desulfovibrionaceae bacterium]MDD2967854.1 IS481 family transposase [Desulfovibrionaceae bacterium]MDD2967905.1 IS481 family transposase [Desulfovibrionaceae bacterium]